MSVINDTSNHVAYIRKLRGVGGEVFAEQASTAGFEPSVDAGLFDYPEWEVGKAYTINELFIYNGQVGFVRSTHTSQETWIPFTTGTESLYGARPRQLPDGSYPYIYNMKVEIDMVVISAKDGKKYKCIQASDPLLYDPAEVPALFTLVE